MYAIRNALTALLLSLPLTGLADTGCEDWFFAVQQALARADIHDAQARTLPGYPHLGVNRWLAFQQQQAVTPAQQQQWIRLATVKAWQDQTLLLQRLPQARHPAADTPAQTLLATCLPVLAARTDFAALPQAEIPDSYVTWLRVVGLYPLTAWLASGSIDAYHREMRARFTEPAPRPHQRFVPPRSEATPVAPQALADNPLQMPLPDASQWQALLQHYAPVLSVADTQPWNVPGRVQLEDRHTPTLNIAEPVSYTWPSWTRFRGQNLLQLNYQFWFSQRPKSGWLDGYSGTLDGLIWRVTLTPDGQVLFYDSIHPCGCYHKIYPVDPSLQAAEIDGDKPVFYPEPVADARQQRVALLLQPDTHYLVRVTPLGSPLDEIGPNGTVPTATYQLAAADTLRALPRPDGSTGSLFNDKGLVPVSTRGERFYLWPMGVPSAGAMRQPGEHAVAFKGRRHFDQAELAEVLFE